MIIKTTSSPNAHLAIHSHHQDKDDEADLIDAFVALGGEPNKTGHVMRSKLVKTVKEDFSTYPHSSLSPQTLLFDLTHARQKPTPDLPIDIEAMIDRLDEDGSGEIEFREFSTLFS